jgi:hypothetical protein
MKVAHLLSTASKLNRSLIAIINELLLFSKLSGNLGEIVIRVTRCDLSVFGAGTVLSIFPSIRLILKY